MSLSPHVAELNVIIGSKMSFLASLDSKTEQLIDETTRDKADLKAATEMQKRAVIIQPWKGS